jgi:hypothetical protein
MGNGATMQLAQELRLQAPAHSPANLGRPGTRGLEWTLQLLRAQSALLAISRVIMAKHRAYRAKRGSALPVHLGQSPKGPHVCQAARQGSTKRPRVVQTARTADTSPWEGRFRALTVLKACSRMRRAERNVRSVRGESGEQKRRGRPAFWLLAQRTARRANPVLEGLVRTRQVPRAFSVRWGNFNLMKGRQRVQIAHQGSSSLRHRSRSVCHV